MAKLTLRAENLFFLSQDASPQQTWGFDSSLRHPRQLRLVPPKRRLGFPVLCSIKERQNIENKRVDGVLTGLRIDGVDGEASSLDSESEFGAEGGSEEVGFQWNWPPWKNIPQRYKLIGTTSLAFVICNMDKVNLSVAIIPMSHQFGWSSSTAGLVQSSFFWGYAISQLPGGWLAKIFGGRKVLEVGVLTWSLATALVPVLAGYMPGLILSRILFSSVTGALERGKKLIVYSSYLFVWINLSSSSYLLSPPHLFFIYRTIPLEERSRAVAFVFGGLSVGSVTGLLLAPSLIQNLGWESVFYIFALLGIGWYSGFQFLKEGRSPFIAESTARPQSIFVNKTWNASLNKLGGSLKDVPWKAFFQSQAVWAMIYAHFCGSWGHYTCLSWLPTYFSEELNLNLTEAAWVSILPPLASIFVTNLSAQFADNLIGNGVETTMVRKICQTIAFLSPAVCMTLSSVD
ncbi:hypothetical protein FEM48_Zijuj01G0188200 [Ziziphus jujuba var. spinosa]|uniref:Major facilitator superfamily (MFS) profile domain-containing protein n=1 Tax=Ziziphus jujuba var. spinosa TaxID=714518 RepID=A0A978W2Z0_ZIZJJ|nr:hypothetical protein FEM48_Zijuj01G0188200 [Ziziphus jujuba var. spinosa]